MEVLVFNGTNSRSVFKQEVFKLLVIVFDGVVFDAFVFFCDASWIFEVTFL